MEDVFHAIPQFFWGRPSSPSDLAQIEEHEGVLLPDDYKHLLLKHGPGEGFIGKHYLVLWDASEILDNNAGYQANIYAKGFLLFGSNGGLEGFAFDFTGRLPPPIVAIPLCPLSSKDAKVIAANMSGFFDTLKTSDDLF